LSATEVDELVHLYQRTATQLSQVRTRVPDPVLVGQLSRDVAAARSAVAGSRSTSWADVGRFVTETFPAAVYRTAGWWAPTAFAGLLVAFGLATWIATHPSVQQALLPPGAARDLTRHAFASYYHAAPAVSFAAQVWTNNAWIAAGSLILGVLLGVPTLLLLTLNMVNLGAVAGYLVADHRAAEFFGLVR
jgi:hypothetical protein